MSMFDFGNLLRANNVNQKTKQDILDSTGLREIEELKEFKEQRPINLPKSARYKKCHRCYRFRLRLY